MAVARPVITVVLSSLSSGHHCRPVITVVRSSLSTSYHCRPIIIVVHAAGGDVIHGSQLVLAAFDADTFVSPGWLRSSGKFAASGSGRQHEWGITPKKADQWLCELTLQGPFDVYVGIVGR